MWTRSLGIFSVLICLFTTFIVFFTLERECSKNENLIQGTRIFIENPSLTERQSQKKSCQNRRKVFKKSALRITVSPKHTDKHFQTLRLYILLVGTRISFLEFQRAFALQIFLSICTGPDKRTGRAGPVRALRKVRNWSAQK